MSHDSKGGLIAVVLVALILGGVVLIVDGLVRFAERVSKKSQETETKQAQPSGGDLPNLLSRPVGTRDEPAGTSGAFSCGECGRTFVRAELVEVRECLECRLQGFNGTLNGQTCPDCKSPSTRRVTDRGCPECLEKAEPTD
jgi:hypothetical protein